MKVKRYILAEETVAGASQLAQKHQGLVRAAMHGMQMPQDGLQSSELLQIRESIDGHTVIYELTYDDSQTPADAFAAVAASLGIPMSQLVALVNHTVWGNTGEESRAAAVQYLIENQADWEEELE